MHCDCHIHMVLDGADWRQSIARHHASPDTHWIRGILAHYQQLGFTYLRDGGDRWGVGKTARALASEYGIVYRTPLAPLCKAGHYGSFIGTTYTNLTDFAVLVRQIQENNGDFIKIMISGLMDFDHAGVLTEDGLPAQEIRELIHIAHSEGFSVMAHANGDRAVIAAAEAGVDSIEHGAYLGEEALAAMKEAECVWVPTLSTIGNLRGKGRFSETALCQILEGAMEGVARFSHMDGLLAPGTDAGAWAVPHGSLTEFDLLRQALGVEWESRLRPGIRKIQEKF